MAASVVRPGRAAPGRRPGCPVPWLGVGGENQPSGDVTAAPEELVPFTDSTDLVGEPDALRARFDQDGYVFLRGVADAGIVRQVHERVTEVCASHGWFRPGTDPRDAITAVEPCVEGEDRYFAVYDDVQRLEAFHALPHHPSVRACMTSLLGDTAFPHPLSIARLVFPANEPWTTPPHQDFPNNQGTEDLYACWVPLTDCPVELGSLSIMRGSHQRGMAPLEFSLGAGNRQARVDERFAGLDWVGGDFALGDVVIFHSLTLHRALPNTTDRMRLSVDYRFQREGEPLTEGCLQPHFARLSWDEIYEGWGRDDLRYYWERKRYDVVPWDESLHAVGDGMGDSIKSWMRWKRDVAASGESGSQASAELEAFRKALAEELRSRR